MLWWPCSALLCLVWRKAAVVVGCSVLCWSTEHNTQPDCSVNTQHTLTPLQCQHSQDDITSLLETHSYLSVFGIEKYFNNNSKGNSTQQLILLDTSFPLLSAFSSIPMMVIHSYKYWP